MISDNVSEMALSTTTGAGGDPTSGRRRARRTTGASGGMATDRSGSVLQTNNAEVLAPPQQMHVTIPIGDNNAAVPQQMRSPLLESLDVLAEDITDVPAGGRLPPIRSNQKPMRAVAPLPLIGGAKGQSAPGDSATSEPPFYFVQKENGFKKTRGWPAMFSSKQRRLGEDNQQNPVEIQRQAENELLEVGVTVQKVQQTTGVFLCGILAGLTSWYVIAGQLLYSHLNLQPTADGSLVYSDAFATFTLFYRQMSMPVGCVFYALIAFCLLTIIDRYDVSFVTRKDILEALRLQNAAVPLLLLYTAALIVTLVSTQHDARIYEITPENLKPQLLSTTQLPMTVARFISPQTTTAVPLVFNQPFGPQGGPLVLNNVNNLQPQTPPPSLTPFLEVEEKMSKDQTDQFDPSALENSVVLWLRLGFARAACCVLAWLILVISSDEDRMLLYLKSLMEVVPSSAASPKPNQAKQQINTPAIGEVQTTVEQPGNEAMASVASLPHIAPSPGH